MPIKRMQAVLLAVVLLCCSLPGIAAAAEPIALDDIGLKKPGAEVVLSGTTSLEEIAVKVLRPDQTVLYVNVLPGGAFHDRIVLAQDAPEGTYTAVAGQGAQMDVKTFEVRKGGSGGPEPTSTPETGTPSPTPTSTSGTGTPSPTPTSTSGTGTPSPTPTSASGTGTPSPSEKGPKKGALPAQIDAAGTAAAVVTQDMLHEALAAAAVAADGTKKLAWFLSETNGARAYALKLPVEALSEASADWRIEVNTPLGVVTLPGYMLAEGSVEEDEITLVIASADTSAWDAELRKAIGGRPALQLSLQAGGREIPWRSQTARVTVSVPYKPSAEERKNSEHIAVWYIDEAGAAFAVPNGKYDAATGNVTFTTGHFSVYGVVFVQKYFADADDAPWAKHEMEVMAAKGIIQGKADAIFGSADPVTRADSVLLLMRMLELKAEAGGGFVDVDASAYYYEAVAAAQTLGIAQGTGNGLFSPGSFITRQDMMTLIDRALRIAGAPLPAGDEAGLSGFADGEQIAEYAQESAAALVSSGVIQGDGNAIRPLKHATRAEAAVILYRLYNML